jgi:hypothetical protein
MDEDASCLATLGFKLPPDVAQQLIEEVYAERQTARREAAEAELQDVAEQAEEPFP